jgi:hypothetical protein
MEKVGILIRETLELKYFEKDLNTINKVNVYLKGGNL